MDLTQPVILGIAGLALLLIGLGAQFRMGPNILGSRGRNRDMWRVGALVGIVLLVWMGGLAGLQTLGAQAGVSIPSGGGGGGAQISCESSTAPSITVTGAQISKSGTAVSGATIAHRLKGSSAWKAGVYGTAITGYAPGSVVEMVLGNQSGTTGSYYAQAKELAVPCAQNVPVNADLAKEATAANVQLYYKNDQGTPNTAITLGTGQTKTGYVVLTGEYQNAFGDASCGANSNVAVLFYNKSQIQNIRIGDWAEVSCPKSVTNSAVANNVSKCFSAPVLTSDQTTGEVALTLQADASNNPTTDIVMSLLDSNLVKNTVTGEYSCGAADDTGADTGIATVIDSTAPEMTIAIS